MPNGECRPSINTLLVSATPSPSASRSRVMRFGLATPAPARPSTIFVIQPLMPLVSSGFGGALVSATSTSPLGRTESARGWSSPVAKAFTAIPLAATGFPPAGQPPGGGKVAGGGDESAGRGQRGRGPHQLS